MATAEQTENVVKLRAFDEVVRLTHRKFDQVDEAHRKASTARLECGLLLLELRQRVQAGEIGDLATWWEWYGDNFTRSRSDAERLIAIAAAENPQQAYQTEKERVRVAVHKHRSFKPAPVAVPCYSNMEKIEEVSKPSLKIVAPTPLPKPEINKAQIEAMIAEFIELSRPEKLEFVRRLRQVYRED
jgi:hypothetical protein